MISFGEKFKGFVTTHGLPERLVRPFQLVKSF
jgi:hypothetical protein